MFDMKVYERQVRNLSNRSTTEFREEQARELLAAKMRDVIRAPVRVSEAEAWEEYERRYDTATVAWIPVKESWAARWAAANASAGRRRRVGEGPPGRTSTRSSPIARRPTRRRPGHLRHILVKLPYGATDDEKAAALAKLSWAVARIKAGESFAEVARETSDDTGSAAQGGDVGDKTDAFVPPFKAAADALSPGETTAGAVETQFGYHFIMRDDPAKAAEVAAQVKRGARAVDVREGQGDGRRQAHRGADRRGDARREERGRRDRDARRGRRAARRQGRAPARPPAPGRGATPGLPPPPRSRRDGGRRRAAAPKPAAPARPTSPSTRASTAIARRCRRRAPSTAAATRSPASRPTARRASSTSRSRRQGRRRDGRAGAHAGRFAVVQLKQHKTATRDEFEKDRDDFVQELVRAKRDEALSLYVKRLRDQAKDDIKVDTSFVQEVKVDGGAHELKRRRG